MLKRLFGLVLVSIAVVGCGQASSNSGAHKTIHASRTGTSKPASDLSVAQATQLQQGLVTKGPDLINLAQDVVDSQGDVSTLHPFYVVDNPFQVTSNYVMDHTRSYMESSNVTVWLASSNLFSVEQCAWDAVSGAVNQDISSQQVNEDLTWANQALAEAKLEVQGILPNGETELQATCLP